MKKTDESFGIISIGTDFPAYTMSIAEIAKKHNYDEEFLKHSLQLKTKRVATRDDEHPSDMATRACRNALDCANISADKVGLVIYTGLSRDYLPAWSAAMAVMNNLKIEGALGYDLTLGCVGSVIGLQNAKRHSYCSNKPYALIVCAERWTHTISPNKESPTASLGHGDGAGAILLGPNSQNPISSEAYYKSFPDFNDKLLIPAGGTVNPPSHETIEMNMHYKKAKKWDFKGVIEHYVSSYSEIISGSLKNDHLSTEDMSFLLMNQVPVQIRMALFKELGLDDSNTSTTFEEFGHVGGADTIIALEKALVENKIQKGHFVIASSTFSTFGAITVNCKKANSILTLKNKLGAISAA